MAGEVGDWAPQKAPVPDLEHMAELASDFAANQDDDINHWLPPVEIERGRAMMKLPADAWQPAEGLATEALIHLVRFFTLAEMQLAGWEGGKTSPVIPLVRILKARDSFTADLRRWIKANTDNRYLPYGSAL